MAKKKHWKKKLGGTSEGTVRSETSGVSVHDDTKEGGTTWAVHEEGPPSNVFDMSVSSEATVMAYIYVMTTMTVVARTQKDPELRRQANYVWNALRDARVFHFDPKTYLTVYHEVDCWTTEVLAGLSWAPSDKGSEEESRHLMETIERESRDVPYPDKLPFSCVFLGYGHGISHSKSFLRLKSPDTLQDRIQEGYLIGHLLTDVGVVVGFYRVTLTNGEQVIFADFLRLLVHGEKKVRWVKSKFNLEPWILPHLIKVVNEHRTFLLESPIQPGLRRQYKDNRKRMGLKPDHWAYTPRPFYTLKLQSQTIKERVRKNLGHPRGPATYRTDVRAHERCRIMRGKLPLDPKLRNKLTKRGYKIFTTNELDKDTLYRLQERGRPFKRSDEWLAVLTTWVESHYTHNDPKLPYIPACRRVPSNVRTKQRAISPSWVHDPASA